MCEIMKLKDITSCLEQTLPLYLQESWDNSGWQVGDPDTELRGVLLALDASEALVLEAIERGCNLIVTHHPLLFKGLKRIGTTSYVERTVALALRYGVSIYAAHTNADNASEGLNALLAQELGLERVSVLSSIPGSMSELTTFVPEEHLSAVQEALWAAGAGRIGTYDSCSFSSMGEGTFRPLEGARPWVGEQDQLEHQREVRLSVVLPTGSSGAVLSALHRAHPYEVPAYSLVALSNMLPGVGCGVIGDLPEEVELGAYLARIKAYFGTDKLMYSGRTEGVIRRVALCGGAGAFLSPVACRAGADIFITGEAKYNDYLDAEGLTFVTVGHYESEEVATRLFASIIRRQLGAEIPVVISEIDNNRIKTI